MDIGLIKILLNVDDWYDVVGVLATVAADEDDVELDRIADAIGEQLDKKDR